MPAAKAMQPGRRANRGTNLYISPAVITEARLNLKGGESLSSVVEGLLATFIKRRSK